MKTRGKILAAAMAATVAAAQASPVTPAEALARVSVETAVRKAAPAQSPVLIETIDDSAGHPAIYHFTFSGSEGFMLLSADDAATPLIGYSETGRFSAADMPSNLAVMVEGWVEQVKEASGAPARTLDLSAEARKGTRKADKAAIAPMLATKWDQTSPFNNQCPLVGGARSVTGCVATAMAQVMNYWEYPAKGQGSISYTASGVSGTLTLDFSTLEFDWANMLDEYTRGKYTSAQSSAVARLMKACGYSVKMGYSPSSSGALSSDIPSALTKYFGYDKGVSRKVRANYSSQDEWNDLIYNALASCGPVIYDGQSTSGGHSFVCDGYDGNGFFHINWGWGGMSDGYFTLNELTPHDIGTGGHYGGYNMQQDAIIGIMPPQGRATLVDLTIDNIDPDSGNVSGWGYTHRISDFSNIALTAKVRVSGGHVSSPLYVTIYEMDPDTKKNGAVALETTFSQPLNSDEGGVVTSTRVNFSNFNPSKFYTLYVDYEFNRQRTTLGSVRFAASSGADGIAAEAETLSIVREGDMLTARGASAIELYSAGGVKVGAADGGTLYIGGLPSGAYVARATGADGAVKTLKLLLK